MLKTLEFKCASRSLLRQVKKSVADQRRSAEEETGSRFQVRREGSAKMLEATLDKDTLLNESLREAGSKQDHLLKRELNNKLQSENTVG